MRLLVLHAKVADNEHLPAKPALLERRTAHVEMQAGSVFHQV